MALEEIVVRSRPSNSCYENMSWVPTSGFSCLVWITLVFSWVLPLVLGLDAWVFSLHLQACSYRRFLDFLAYFCSFQAHPVILYLSIIFSSLKEIHSINSRFPFVEFYFISAITLRILSPKRFLGIKLISTCVSKDSFLSRTAHQTILGS